MKRRTNPKKWGIVDKISKNDPNCACGEPSGEEDAKGCSQIPIKMGRNLEIII